MIKLIKGDKPAVLVAHGEEWLNIVQTALAEGRQPSAYEKSRYRHADIKAALRIETHGKCAYCESYLLHIAFGDIEHIVPKSFAVEETFRWENLTLACDICNTYKGDGLDLIDPYIDDPNEHFIFFGPMVVPKPASDRALVTEKRVRLNRSELLERRGKKLGGIATQIALIEKAGSAQLKAALAADLILNETSDGAEFAAVVRGFIGVMKSEVSELDLENVV